ncbi:MULTISPECIES: site-specific integrase [unclassified Labrenzia]|uniref:tyrosine-type recombinase/integrase n=1 Tax=unclassified Labrenzia TaxID=2648686 RepID=UPI0004B36885|nr:MULTISPECIES: site-specific integrase [unclassified Labrenzia]
MLIDVKYLQKRGKSAWRYRRKVAKHLRDTLQKTEFVIPLGNSESAAIRAYPRVHAKVELDILTAERGLHSATPSTPLERYKEAQTTVAEWGFDPKAVEWDTEADPRGIARDAMIDTIERRYRRDDEGYPIDVSPEDSELLRILAGGAKAKPPKPTLEDARKQYLKDVVGENKKRIAQLERVFRLMTEVLPALTPLSNITRQQAREVRDHMLDGRSAASVQRYLNVVRAMINHANTEFEIAPAKNPFMRLSVEKADKPDLKLNKRKPFSEPQLEVVRARVLSMARDDLKLIWRLLEATGCRISEITGLRRTDIALQDTIPHIRVEWHENRRIKTEASHRLVPLVGDAIDAAREALSLSSGEMVFPAYGREGGGDSASAALGKHVRACIDDRKVTTHSLRHRIKTLTLRAGVPRDERRILLGHTQGGGSEEVYDDEPTRLVAARRALLAAYEEADKLKQSIADQTG